MSERRPPKARQDHGQTGSDQGKDSNVFLADHWVRPDDDVDAEVPADAATLGFADLAERVPGAELAEFRDLRARLFGDIDVSEPAFPETDLDVDTGDAAATATPFVPEQVRIANGALTAAEIAAADGLDELDEVEDEVGEAEVGVGEAEVGVDDRVADFVDDVDLPAPEVVAVEVDEVEAPTPTVVEPASAPAAERPQAATSQDWAFSDTATVSDVTESEDHRGPWILIAAAVVAVASLVVGWFVFSGGDSSREATPTQADPPVMSQSSSAQASSTSEVDDESLRTSQRFVFDEEISQISLAVPKRPADSAAADFDVQVNDLVISIPGQPNQQVNETLGTDSDTVTIDLASASDDVTISYTALGAVMRTEPSSAHRAIVLVTPIEVATADGSTGLVSVKGSDVLNLGCAAGVDAMQACGERTEEGWEVAVPTLDTDVIAQVDLPRD